MNEFTFNNIKWNVNAKWNHVLLKVLVNLTVLALGFESAPKGPTFVQLAFKIDFCTESNVTETKMFRKTLKPFLLYKGINVSKITLVTNEKVISVDPYLRKVCCNFSKMQ